MEAPEPGILLLTCIRRYRDESHETVMEPKDDLHLAVESLFCLHLAFYDVL